MPGIFFFIGTHFIWIISILCWKKDAQVEKYPFDVYKYKKAFYNFVLHFRLEF